MKISEVRKNNVFIFKEHFRLALDKLKLIMDNPDDSVKNLYDAAGECISELNLLRHNLKDLSQYSKDPSDWI